MKSDQATIYKNHHCGNCGWPIIFALCNDEFVTFKDASGWDWWLYCTNKGCVNHDGEGLHQDHIEWVKPN